MKKIIILILTLNVLFAFVDKNNNGIMDSWEKKYNITDANADPDSDGLSNYEEFIRQSDPLKYDKWGSKLIKIKTISTEKNIYGFMKYKNYDVFLSNHVVSVKKDDTVDKFNISTDEVKFKDNYMFCIDKYDNNGYIKVINLNNSQEENVDFETTWSGYSRALDIGNNYLALLESANVAVVTIFDISKTTNPKKLSSIKLTYKCAYSYDSHYKIIIKGNYLYVAGETEIDGNIRTFFEIIDISEPDNPKSVNVTIIDGYESFYKNIFQVKGNLLYIASNDNLFIYDVSDLTNPVLIKKIVYYNSKDIKFGDNYIYTVSYDTLKIYDFDFNVVKEFNIYGIERINLFIENNKLYIPNGSQGIDVYDLTYLPNPLNESIMIDFENFNELINNKKLVIYNHDFDVLKLNKYLDIYELLNNGKLVLKRYYLDGSLIEEINGTYNLLFEGNAIGIDIDNDYYVFYNANGYLAKAKDNKFEYVDGYVSDKSIDSILKNEAYAYFQNSIIKKAYLDCDLKYGSKKGLIVFDSNGSAMYVSSPEGILIYDINNTFKPYLKTTIYPPNYPQMYVKDNILYVYAYDTVEGMSGNYLRKYDISNPFEPKLIDINQTGLTEFNDYSFDKKIPGCLKIYKIPNKNEVICLKQDEDYDEYHYDIVFYDIKAFDKDFDGVPDKYDLYPEDSSRYVKDSDGDGLIDEINPNTTLDNPIYDNLLLDPDYFVFYTQIPSVIKSEYIEKDDSYTFENSNGIINAYIVDVNGTKYQLNPGLFNVSWEELYGNGLNQISKINLGNSVLIQPYKTGSFLFFVNSDLLPQKDMQIVDINSYHDFEEESNNINDTANTFDNAFSIYLDEVYKGSSYYTTLINNSGITWLKLYLEYYNDLNNMDSDNKDGVSVYNIHIFNDSISLYDENGESNVTLIVYEKSDDKIQAVKKVQFNGKKDYNLTLPLDSSKEYYVKLVLGENIKKYQYKFSVIKQETYYYKNLFTDQDGKLRFDFVLPKSKGYRIFIISDNKFEANLTDYQNQKRVFYNLAKNSYNIDFVAGLKAKDYSIYIDSKPKSNIKIAIIDSQQQYEIEPNDLITEANNYYNQPVKAVVSNENDIDYYGFKINSGSFKIQISSNMFDENEEIWVLLYSALDPLQPVGLKILTSDEIKDNSLTATFSGYNSGSYYIAIQRQIGKFPFNYTLKVSGDFIQPLELTKEEKIYAQQYNEYLLNNMSYNFENINLGGEEKGEAIILAGIGDEPNDPLFLPTQKLAVNIYKLFRLRGFSDNDIYFIDANTSLLVNNVNLKDVVDDSNATVKSFLKAIEYSQNNNKTGVLYIYLIDHGANGAFKISGNDRDNDGKIEILYAKELDLALDEFQEKTGRPVVIIIEACKSGSFIDYLKGNNRVIITSSEAAENSVMMPNTAVSFTKYLANYLLAGNDIGTSFNNAKEALHKAGSFFENQHPQIFKSDNLSNLKIGGDFAFAGMELLNINNYFGKEGADIIDLSNQNNLVLYEEVASSSPISKVWAVVIPPNYKEVLVGEDGFYVPDLTPYIVNMKYNKDTQRYEGTFDLSGYKYNGDFNITYYVQDSDGNVVSKNVTLKAVNGKDYVSTENNTNQSNNETTDDGLSINIYSGWNMVGITEDIDDMSVFDNYEIVWAYNNGYWRAYSPKEELMSKINSLYTPLYSISAGEGVWIYSFSKGMFKKSDKDNKEISFDVNQWYLVNYSNGVKEEMKNGFVLIWRYNTLTKKWQVYSNKPEYESVINTLVNKGVYEKLDADSLKAGDGIWFYKL